MITFVVAASGLKYVGVGATTLGWILCVVLLIGASVWFVRRRPWSATVVESRPTDVTPRPDLE